MQIEIGQERRDDTALRCAFAVCLAAADVPLRSVLVHFHDRGFEPHLDDVQNRTVTDALGDHGHEFGMGNGVEVLGHIGVDDFRISAVQGIAICHRLRHGLTSWV